MCIVGRPLRPHLERLGASLGLNSSTLRFTGPLYDGALPAALAELELVVNPTLRAWAETFCIANIEVMAMGLPLVTWGVGGVGEHVREDGVVGVRVDEPTPAALAEGVVKLLRDPEEARRMGLRGRQRVVEEFTLERMVSGYEELYERGERSKFKRL